MKNLTILQILLFSTFSLFAQVEWEWSTPKALSDSSSNNQNAIFMSMRFSPTVLWEKEINLNTTALCLKSIRNTSDIEHIILQKEGVKYTQPAGYEGTWFYEPDEKIIVFNAEDENTTKLQYITIIDGVISDPINIAEHECSSNSINLNADYLTWLNDSCVWISEYNPNSHSFGIAEKLIQGGVYSPRTNGYHLLTYLKKNGDNTEKVSKRFNKFENDWVLSTEDSTSFEGELGELDITNQEWFSNGWCAEVNTGIYEGDIILIDNLETQYLTSDFQLIEPDVDGVPLFVDNFNAYSFFTCVSDSLGQYEVYAFNPYGAYFNNVSKYEGADRNPAFFTTFYDGNTARLYLIWESVRQGYKTLYYSYLDYTIESNFQADPKINISISPNPLTSQTTITFPVMQNPVVKIYSMQGKEIRNLSGFVYANSNEQVVWDGKDNSGKSVPAGNYLVVVQGDKGVNSTVIVKQ